MVYGQKMLFDDQILDSSAKAALDARYPDAVTVLHGQAVDSVSDHDPVLATYLVN